MHPATIKEAKAFVRGIAKDKQAKEGTNMSVVRASWNCPVVYTWYFEVEPPTVTCHVELSYGGIVFKATETATCGRKDTFDEQRGKLIAMGRADAEIASGVVLLAEKLNEIEQFNERVKKLMRDNDLHGVLSVNMPNGLLFRATIKAECASEFINSLRSKPVNFSIGHVESVVPVHMGDPLPIGGNGA